LAIFFPQEKIREIKNSADIVDIVSEAVLLKKRGKNHVGLCPFHSEKTPSFTVSPQKQIFYCFGCGTGGNVFSFLMKQEGLSFPEAASVLAGRFGIEVPTQKMSPEQRRQISERENLLAVNREAMDFFRRSLHGSDKGKQAVDYLNKRGMKREITDRFNLGYAPEGWDKLVTFFSKKKIPLERVKKSGLIVPRKSERGFYDRFRDRIIFPIFNINKQVIGFGGRVMDDSLPKYLNSPETPVYNKRKSLYGLHEAKGRCRESQTVYVVEGYFDLLALHQHGLRDSVATLGTAITPDHVKILRGFVGKDGKLILVYDSDAAGIKAAQRSIEVFEKGFVNARILVLPAGHDPDSFLFEFGAESLLNAAAQAPGIIPFLIDSAEKKHGLSIEGKIRVISDLRKPLASIHDSVARSLYIKELAERTGIDEAAILEKVRETSPGKKAPSAQMVADKGGRIEKKIISMMLQFPEILPEIARRNVIDVFEDGTLKSIGQIILKQGNGSGDLVSETMAMIDDDERKRIIASLAIEEEIWSFKECVKLIAKFMEISSNQSKKVLMEKIQAAEKENNQDLLVELLYEKQKMAVINEKRKMAILSEKMK
jgi:DNA primase